MPAYFLHITSDLDSQLKDQLEALPDISLLTIPAGTDTSILAAEDNVSKLSHVRFIDARSGDPLLINSMLACGSHVVQELPVLLLVEPATLVSDLLDRLNIGELTPVELISVSDMDSALFKMRLRLLTHRGPPLTQDPVRDNAYAILQQVMRVSNDWMV
ncbi:MAG: hypothetical protein KTR32_27345, partial [Granulosicoccus sp.]|nr:hypothetical protein [Granulosicoccus sp.]